MDLLAVERDGAGVRLVEAEQAHRELGTAGAQQARDAQDLALAQLEADVVVLVVEVQVLDLQNGLLAHVLGNEVVVGQLAAGHVEREIAAGQLVGLAGVDILAVPHDADVVGNLKDLLDLVADEHDGDARVAQLADGLEEGFDLLLREGRGRLVHDDELRVEQQGAADGDQLLVRDAEIAHLVVEIDVVADLREGLLRGGLPALAVDQLPAGGDLGVDGQVFHDGQVRENGQVLIDDLDAELRGLGRRDLGDHLVLEDDLAFVLCVDAGDDLDQRRFAAAVFTGQTHNLAGSDCKVHMVKGVNACERFADPGHLK